MNILSFSYIKHRAEGSQALQKSTKMFKIWSLKIIGSEITKH